MKRLKNNKVRVDSFLERNAQVMKYKRISIICSGMICLAINMFGGEFDSLITNSPFGYVDSQQAKNLVKSGTSYELRGVFLSNRAKLFNVYNILTRKSKWVKQGDNSGEIAIEAFDQNSKTLHFYTKTGEKHSVRMKNHRNSIQDLGITLNQ